MLTSGVGYPSICLLGMAFVLWIACSYPLLNITAGLFVFLIDLQVEFILDKNLLPFIGVINIFSQYAVCLWTITVLSFPLFMSSFEVLWSVYSVLNLGLVLFLAGFISSWTWVWVNSGSWWWTGRPGMLRSMGFQSRTWLNDWTELNWTDGEWDNFPIILKCLYSCYAGLPFMFGYGFLQKPSCLSLLQFADSSFNNLLDLEGANPGLCKLGYWMINLTLRGRKITTN